MMDVQVMRGAALRAFPPDSAPVLVLVIAAQSTVPLDRFDSVD